MDTYWANSDLASESGTSTVNITLYKTILALIIGLKNEEIPIEITINGESLAPIADILNNELVAYTT